MGSIYYHGTTEENALLILENGFKEGTYFTWDLHSALMMGGPYILAVYFDDLDHTKYWEYISTEVIKRDKILYLRKFTVQKIYENLSEDRRIKLINFKKYFNKENIILCTACNGKGQLNYNDEYSRIKGPFIACNNCNGHGYIEKKIKNIKK